MINENPVAVRNNRSRWRGKNYERRVAGLIGGVVVGRSKAVNTGKRFIQVNCQKPPDVVNDWLSVECKYYKKLPAFLSRVMTQALANCPREQGLTPVAWVGQREGREHFVIMTEKDFIDLHGGK